MKTRNGFVSNSSSSSFIIAIERKPKDFGDFHTMMAKECGKDVSVSTCESLFYQVSKIEPFNTIYEALTSDIGYGENLLQYLDFNDLPCSFTGVNGYGKNHSDRFGRSSVGEKQKFFEKLGVNYERRENFEIKSKYLFDKEIFRLDRKNEDEFALCGIWEKEDKLLLEKEYEILQDQFKKYFTELNKEYEGKVFYIVSYSDDCNGYMEQDIMPYLTNTVLTISQH